MGYSIHQVSLTSWELRDPNGTVLGVFHDAPGRDGYKVATEALGGILTAQLATAGDGAPAPTGTGVLPEKWVSDKGLAFSVDLPGSRDFSTCKWSWRDPQACLVPLMFQTSTDFGHMGAELAGFVEHFELADGTVKGGGSFYDNEVGIKARDVLLARGMGVSVDPTEKIDVDYHDECTEWDEDGFCTDGDFAVIFLAYEIGGVTMTPFPGFEEASIILDTSGSASGQPPPVRAALSIPTAPPREWLTLAEPRPGVPFIDGRDGGEVLVEQMTSAGEVAGLAVPLTLRDDGLVYGHLTWWGQCHVADPWGAGVCASASKSKNGYADFLTGHVVCADGTDVATGELVVGCEHSDKFDVAGVRDHLAHAGMGWASVHVVDGEYGPWLTGVLRPDLTEAQVRVLRSLSLSGEWVGELAGILAVNAPGLPVQRGLAASAFGWPSAAEEAAGKRGFHTIPMPALRASTKGGVFSKLVGANIVRRCVECEKRAALGGVSLEQLTRQVGQLTRVLAVVERRTRSMVATEAEATMNRITASTSA